MFDLQQLIDALATATGFEVSWAKESQPDLRDVADLAESPRLYVGALGLQRISSIEYSGSVTPYEQYADDLRFTLSVHIVTSPQELYRHWGTIHAFLLGWSPINAIEADYSGLTYAQGDMLGLNNARAWWLDQWFLSIPAVTFNP